MLYTPVTLLKQEARFLCPIFFVALWLVDAVPVARVLPVEVLLRRRQGFRTLAQRFQDGCTDHDI